MYIRVKNKAEGYNKSVQIVESFRIGNSVKQKIIKHVGVAYDDEQLKQLKLLANSIKDKIEENNQLFLFTPEELDTRIIESQKKKDIYSDEDYQVDVRDLDEESRFITGIHDIYGKLFDELGLNKVLANPARNESAVNLFKQIVLARVANPDSKRESVNMLNENFGISLDLDKVYRMMDKLDEKAIEKLNAITYQQTRKLFNEKIDVVFFDVTTIYFESFTEDEFKRNGYSKDLKFNQPQVLLALMVTKEGLPIGYQAFSGDTYEGHTLIPSLKTLKEKYELDKIVYVADSGMFNEDNLAELDELEQGKFEYIVGARIKNMPNNLKEKILDPQNYQKLNSEISVANFEYKGRKLIVTYSEKRAKKDRADRIKGIQKLQKKLSKSSNIKNHLSNQGYKKYLKIKIDKGTELVLNQDKIIEDEAWDGLKGLIVNENSTLSNQEILSQYGNLWQIEQSFRITKHDLKIRPVYHWKPDRVKAHIAISFAAYTLLRHLEYRVNLQYKKLSPEIIRKTLLSVQTSVLVCNKKKIKYALPSRMNNDAKKIYRLMEVKKSFTPHIISKF